MKSLKVDNKLILMSQNDGYMSPINQITLLCISLIFIEMKCIYSHSCMMFAIKVMSMCND